MRLLWGLAALLPLHQYLKHGDEIWQWDLLLFTGVLTLILGLRVVAGIRYRCERLLMRLNTRKVLNLNPEQQAGLLADLEQDAQTWARVGGLMAMLAIFVSFAVVLLEQFSWQQLAQGLAQTLGAYVVGTLLGRMVSYGQLARQLKRKAIAVEIQPLHVDEAAGLKPVGDFFFHQALIAMIPAIFLALWWFLFPIWPRDYSHWEQPYIALLSIAILVEVLAFLLPIWLFHHLMQQQKQQCLQDADKLSNDIAELQMRLEADKADKIEMLQKQYWAIENMRTWPVDIKTTQRFRWHNILLIIPLVGDIAKRNFDWPQMLTLFNQWLA